MNRRLKLGLPRIHAEPGEKRDFLPEFVAGVVQRSAEVYLEGYGPALIKPAGLPPSRPQRFLSSP
jgi:hypothetical protein